jgi:hypothetical protein
MSSLFDPDRSAERLPVSLITGFLGSGKTTLLNRLVQRPELADSLVIINEFGEVELDHLLVEPVEGETVVLATGCLCCAVRGDLQDTLSRLLVERDRGESGFAGVDRNLGVGRPGAGRAAVPEQPAAGLLSAPRCDCRDDRWCRGRLFMTTGRHANRRRWPIGC